MRLTCGSRSWTVYNAPDDIPRYSYCVTIRTQGKVCFWDMYEKLDDAKAEAKRIGGMVFQYMT